MAPVDIAVFLVALVASVLAVTAIAGRLDIPAPLVLVVAGIAASYVPGMPEVHLHEEVVLLGLLPPLLYSVAIQTSLVDFNANRRPILLLSVGLVVFTTAGVGVLVHALLPGLGWPAAIAIGAVVAPPDAVAATAVGRRIGLPRRIVTILEGESLLNDATALVALRTAIAAAGVSVTALDVGVDFVRAAGGGLLIGIAFFIVVAWLRKRVTDPLMDVGISLVVPFAAYISAEKVHASGVIAVVIAGLLLGHKSPILQDAQSRIAERTNWRTIAFILENAVFLLIGLQAEWLLADVEKSDLSAARIAAVCGLTLVAVIVLRLVWVFPVALPAGATRSRPVDRQAAAVDLHVPARLGRHARRGDAGRGVRHPGGGTEHREVLLLIAFTVVAGTLLIQGLTLPVLARRLKVPSPDPMDDALARATLLQQASKAGHHALEQLEYEDHHGVVDLIKQRINQRNFAAWERLGTTADEESPSDLYARIRLAMIEAERGRVLEIRSGGTVPSEVVSDVLAMLDVEESMLDRATEEREDLRTTPALAAGRRGVRPPGGVPRGRDDAGPGLRPVRWPTAPAGWPCASAWSAATVGCCDSSPGQHATGHFHETTHPVMQSAEPGEDWRWCYVHHQTA